MKQIEQDMRFNEFSIRRLTFSYALALFLLSLIAVSNHLILSYIVESQRNDAAVVNISGRQRMLSQKTGMLVERLIHTGDIAEREKIRVDLSNAVAMMAASHNALLNGDAAMGLNRKLSGEVLSMYHEPPLFIDKKVRDYIDAVRDILNTPDAQSIAEYNAVAIDTIRSLNTSDLLNSLDSVVWQYQMESESHIARLRRTEITLMLVNLSGLLMIALLIFKPMSFRIKKDIEELKKANRMKDEFVSTVSHELRTPLTSIHGSLGLVIGGAVGDISASVREMLNIALKNSQRLINLVNDILDVEKIESGRMEFKMEMINLSSIIRQAIESNYAFARQFDVKFRFEDALSVCVVYADSNRIMQVMNNLISNAVKFSYRGGTVEVNLAGSSGYVRVSVSNRGPGIPEEFKDRIFQRFAQADPSDSRQQGGTGLGLSICKAIVERHGGKIGFESKPGIKTTFYFDLPENYPAPSSDKAAIKPRILICEDDKDIATLLRILIRQSGFNVDTAYNAEDAGQLLNKNQYSAMILDLILPGKSGTAFIKELREDEKTRELPIVVVSIKADEEKDRVNGGALSVVDWINKPIDYERLLSAIRISVYKGEGKPKILHIEDDPDIIKLVSVILQDMADVTCAMNYQDAVEKIEAGDFALIILDMMLPDNSGTEILKRLEGRETPVIIFSALEVEEDIMHKVSAALVKSRASNEELRDAIISALGQKWIRD
jgi:signal transduction histidine kinase/DNA-binding response OmpR family regulator